MLEKTVSTFDVKVPYDEWVGKFDNDEAPAISAIGIKVIFRGVSKDNPEKAIVLVQAKEDVLGKHIQENIEIFEENGAVMSTAEPSLWSWGSKLLRYK